MKKCECGAENDAAAIFCDTCGRPLEAPSAHRLRMMCSSCGRFFPSAAKFCDICGRPLAKTPEVAPRLVLSSPGGEAIVVAVHSRDLGRSDFASWLGQDEAQRISRAQFRILVSESSFVLEHLGTTNPTLLNGREVTRPQRLESGDIIDLARGALRLLVTIDPEQATSPPAAGIPRDARKNQ